MIYIIGTWHRFQVWAETIRNGESFGVRKEHVEAFENYLTDLARSLKADMIAEESSEDFVADHGHGATSVAEDITKQLSIQHLFCNPSKSEYRALGLKFGAEMRDHALTISRQTGREIDDVFDEEVRKQSSVREAFWRERLESWGPNNKTIIFVCGADHVDSFKEELGTKGILARIQYREWTPQA
jgi:hypothetical protein